MTLPNITDPFLRQLYTKLAEEIDNRITSLVSGSASVLGSGIGIDATTTAIKYHEQVSYIKALQDVIELGIEIDHERYGNRTKDNGDD